MLPSLNSETHLNFSGNKPLNLIWVMPAEEIVLQPLTKLPYQAMVKQRHGHLGEHYEKQLSDLTTWLRQKHGVNLGGLQQKRLRQTLETGLLQTRQQLEHTLESSVPQARKLVTSASVRTRLQQLLFGKPKLSGLLFHLAAWQYLPSAIITPITEAQILKHTGLPEAEQHRQVQKEVSRQVTGAALHFTQTYSSFGFKEFLKKLSQKQNHPALKRLFQNESRENALSLMLLMLFNGVGYGILRPLTTNGMFMGMLQLDKLRHNHEPRISSATRTATLGLTIKPTWQERLQAAFLKQPNLKNFTFTNGQAPSPASSVMPISQEQNRQGTGGGAWTANSVVPHSLGVLAVPRVLTPPGSLVSLMPGGFSLNASTLEAGKPESGLRNRLFTPFALTDSTQAEPAQATYRANENTADISAKQEETVQNRFSSLAQTQKKETFSKPGFPLSA